MPKRGVGAIFCLIAAILYAARYVVAATYYSGTSGPWGSQQFQSFLGYVGPPWVMIWLALLVGITYLVWGEIDDSRSK